MSDVPPMVYGNKPTDNGFLFLTEEEKLKLIKTQPNAEKFIKDFFGAEEFINNKKRYCIWLVKASPAEIKQIPEIYDRVQSIRQFRLASTKAATRKKADIPTLFDEIRQPETGHYLLVPRHSSENRFYVPIGYVSADVICGDSNQMIPNATLYHFCILTSSVHMAWMRAVCGRLKSDYRYSKDIVYNNFVWPSVTETDQSKIEKTAQKILDARALYPDSSLADLYDATLMPVELRRATVPTTKPFSPPTVGQKICRNRKS